MLHDALSLPRIDMPLPERVLRKWSKWKAWRDEVHGETWVAYGCRHTAEPLPEWCGDVTYDPTRSFFFAAEWEDKVTTNPEDSGPYEKIVTIPFVTHGAMVPVERMRDLVSAVRSGNLPRKPEGGPYPILPEVRDAA